jgi:ribosomal protein S12 methylthiotransferase accessory factor
MEMTIDFPGGSRVDARVNGFTVHTDQPQSNGGDNTAPSPFVLFLASLGACAGYYVLNFCRQRDIPTAGIRLIQRAEQDPETHLVGKVSIAIYLPPGFPEKYIAAVTRAAEQCTLKRHLEKPPSIEVKAYQSKAAAIGGKG